MPRVWRSVAALAALLLAGCGGGPERWSAADPSVVLGGVRVEVLIAAVNDDQSQPSRRPAQGTHCIVYSIRVQAVDGHSHDLRPDAFSAGGGTPLDAVGRCNTPQMEPTTVRSEPRYLQLTIVERTPDPAPLLVQG